MSGLIDVRVVDTRTVTLGQAMVVLEAARVAAATGELDAAEAAARAVVPSIRVFGALDTMDNVRKGGRIGAAKALMGSLLVDQADRRDSRRRRARGVEATDPRQVRSSTS